MEFSFSVVMAKESSNSWILSFSVSPALAKATNPVTVWAVTGFTCTLAVCHLSLVCVYVCIVNWYRMFGFSAFLVLNFNAMVLMLCDKFSLPGFLPFLRNSEPRSSVCPTETWRPELFLLMEAKIRKTGNVSLKKPLFISNDQTQVFLSSSLWFYFF